MLESVEFILTLIAIILGGIGAYIIFVMNRKKLSETDKSHNIEIFDLDKEKSIRLTLKIKNKGKVMLPVNSGKIWLQHLKPVDKYSKQTINKFKSDEVSKKDEIEWPLTKRRYLEYQKDNAGELEPGNSLKIFLVEKAIEKTTHDHQFAEDESASKFWHDYWRLTNELAPDLNMPIPDGTPAIASFIYFHPENLASELSLIHKFNYGNADLSIPNAAKKIENIRQALNHIIPKEFHIQQTDNAVVIRKKVPILNLNNSLESQIKHATKCIEELRNLYNWYLEYRNSFHFQVKKALYSS